MFYPLRRRFEPIISRFMHVYWRFSRPMTLGVRALVIDGDGRVFLVRHTYVEGWHLPGGGVEAGEPLLLSLARELKEEGNIDVTGAPVLHGIFFNDRSSRRDHVAVYVVRAFTQSAPPAPNHEIAATGFYPVDALPDDTTKGTRARIAEVLGGLPAAERW
jgi:8-oxo-dGTP pyrophosphatase MutT (NUDIX family)